MPGNAPAPNFDPTKSNSVVISSAGQLGRGGNITIDGADNNDDVVGGPLQNVTQESVQEFQIATNRFTAESGRSASSVINVVTKSGTDQAARLGVALRARQQAGRACRRPSTGRSGDSLPVRSPAAGGRRRRSAGVAARRSGSAQPSTATRTARCSSASATSPTRTIRRTFARRAARRPARIGTRGLASERRRRAHDPLRRRARRRHRRQQPRPRDRLGVAAPAQPQHATTRSSAPGPACSARRCVNAATVSFSTFDNEIVPVASGPQLTFPSIQDGTSFRVPQGTTQKRFQVADTRHAGRAAPTACAPAASGSAWTRCSTSACSRTAASSSSRTSPTFDHNGDGRVDDGDLLFAVTLRSGKPDQALVLPDADNDYVALFVQDDWRVRPTLTLNLGLRYEVDTDVKNISRVDEINPIVQPFLQGTRQARSEQLRPADRLQLGARRRPDERARRLRHLLRPRSRCEIQSLERGLDGRALPIEVRAGNVFFLDPTTGPFPPFAPSMANPFTGFILPGAGASGINIIDNGMQNPSVQQWNLGFERELPRGRRAARRRRPQPRHALHHRPHHRRGVQPGRRRTRSRRQPRVEREHALRRAARQRRAPRRAPRLPRVLHVRARRSTTPTTIRFRSRTGRSIRTNLRLEYGPTPNDQRHRFTVAAWAQAPAGFLVAPHPDPRVRRADGHPDAGRRSRASRRSSATPAAASSRPGPSSTAP